MAQTRTKIAVVALLAAACTSAASGEPRALAPAQLISRLEQAWGSWQDYQYTGRSVSGGKTTEFRYYYMRPDFVRIDTRRGQVSVQPDGDIRGRLGKGLFGSISRRLDRSDKRLRDAEGIPFYDTSLPATLARIRDKVSSGANATVQEMDRSYVLAVRSGDTTWKYYVDRQSLAPEQSERFVNGGEVEVTRYVDFRPNVGLSTGFFKF